MKGRTPRTVKVVITGPFAAGKTTLIRTISEIRVLSTERQVSDHNGDAKRHTTVAMDFGRVTVAGDLAIYLFGTPGQERFDFMWEILSEGMLGFVLVVDGTDGRALDDARRILAFFARMAAVPFVVAVNKLDSATPDTLAHVRRELEIPEPVPVLACDTRDREDVKQLLVALLEAVLATIEARSRGALAAEAGR